MLRDLALDVRYALRRLAAQPGFTLAAVLTLALGLGASVAVFSILRGVLGRPLPHVREAGLFALQPLVRGGLDDDLDLTLVEVEEYARSARSLAGIGFHIGRALTLTGGGEPVRLEGGSVTPSFLPLVGVEPLLGRHFREDEARAIGQEEVAVLSHSLWRDRYGSDPAVLGRTIEINQRQLTVVGVLPPGFFLPESDLVYLPFAADEQSRRWSAAWTLARLAPGVAPEAARAELSSLLARLAPAHPELLRNRSLRLVPLRRALVDDRSRLSFRLMAGAVALVLLVACANVAGLLLVKGAARREEIALRAALGAGRSRVVRQLLAEGLVLALAGGALGVVLAQAGLGAVASLRPGDTPLWLVIEIDRAALGFALLLSLGTMLLFALVPALRAARVDLAGRLAGQRTAGGTPQAQRLRGMLVAGQLALSLTLVTAATLCGRSLVSVLAADAGFATAPLYSARGYLPGDRYDAPEAKARAAQRLAERAAALPGAAAAALTTAIPADDGGPIAELLPDLPWSEPEPLATTLVGTTRGLFATLGVPLLAGRTFEPAEEADPEAPVAIVNRALAARLFGDREPLGRRLRLGTAADAPWLTVVGVAPDLVYEEFGEGTPRSRLQLYVPIGRRNSRGFALLVRAAGSPLALAAPLRPALREIEADLPLFEEMTMSARRGYTAGGERFFASIFGLFALVALALAAVGLYGVVAHEVAQRRQELGVRMALGADAGRIERLVLGRSGRVIGGGLLVGLAGAFAAARALASLLYGAGAGSLSTYLGSALLLAATGLAAAWLPARRAGRTTPMEVLRSE
jgi:predicted permease